MIARAAVTLVAAAAGVLGQGAVHYKKVETVTDASGPGPADWLAGLFRGLHPVRWLLCLVGLIVTGLSLVVALALFQGGPLNWPGWRQQPIERLQALQSEILDGSLGRIILRGSLLLALNTALWCFIGGWIARHELVARRHAQDDTAEGRAIPGVMPFLVGCWKSLLRCCLVVLILALLMIQPVLVAGWVNTFLGGLGAVAVSLLLPVVLVADLVFFLIALGSVGWPLMPIAIAAECGDSFDAVSRGYSYVFQHPVRFLLLTAISLCLAGLPVAAVYASAEQMAAWQAEIRQSVCCLAAALSASIFWSLQTLVYLHLRWVVDDVDAGEIAVERRPKETPKSASSTGNAAEVPPSGDSRPARGRSTVPGTLMMLATVVGTWWLTFCLFTRASGGPAEWLGWGLSDTWPPPAKGLYRVASMIAGLWGVAWLALPLMVAARRLLRAGATPDKWGQESA